MFWRDTAQWAQSLMLFGLLAVYIFNLRHFSQQLSDPFWTQLVSFLNLGACSLNLATLTTRFVYPQFSLEGKRLWIVGMAPLGLAI
jgi:ABC-2 type transport system permease protein